MPAVRERPSTASSDKPERRKRWWRRFKWTLRVAVLLAIAGKSIVGFDGCFYYPSREVFYTPDQLGLDYEDVTFKASDGVKLSGWFVPARAAPRGTVIHFHGNADNMTGHVPFVAWLPRGGYNLLVFDYRGYGQSDGKVTRKGTILDGHAALDYVLSRPDVAPQRVFAFGQSIGGAVAIVVAAERPELRAVVVDSAFSSYRRIAAMHLRKMLLSKWLARTAARLALSTDYDPIDHVDRLTPRPLLVIASGKDEICFPELSRELYDAAREPKEFWLVPEATHAEAVFLEPDETQRRITGLFDELVRRQQ
jgi:fermentation-respiration switch protein FrsA (DUF1100 family)